MCLYANQTLHKAAAQCSGVVGLHLPHRSLCPRTPSRRRQPQLNAVLLQETLPQQQNQVPSRSKGTSSTLQNSSSSQGGMPSFRPVLPMQQASSVEVHFQVQYGCEFGQHLSIIGTPQGWHVPAAVPMTWSEGDVWNAVLSVPVGTDIEYKYVVVWDDGNIVRWQDGPNNSLSVQHPGVLMHVQDTWSQRERSVREVGPRLDHDQHTKQSGGHSSGAASVAAAGSLSPQSAESSSAPKATAAGPSTEVFNSKDSSALPRAAGATAAVLPVQPAWGGVLQSHSLLFDQFDPAAAGEDDDLLQYEDEEEDQHWPAEMLQKAAEAAVASPAAPTGQALAGSQSSVRADQQGSVARRGPTPVATPTADVMAAAAAAASSSKQTQLQQQQAAAADLAELLPMLRTELASALAELAKHPEAAQEHGHLLSEGQTVLAALQQQVAGNSSPSSSKSSSSRSPGRSPSATLTSGDEIAAALLSDDCEEACFCMVDAICSCADWDLNCACEADTDTPCALPEDAAAHAPAQTARQDIVAWANHSTTQVQPARASVHAPAMRAVSDIAPASNYSRSSAAPAAVSVSELARAAAVAARYDPAVLAAREKSFTDVQEALQKSAQLLQALTDPCHPLVLEADRKLASASRQLHSGHLLN